MLIRERHLKKGIEKRTNNLPILNTQGMTRKTPKNQRHLISSSITNITPSARNTLNPSTAHQSPPHSAASTLNPNTAHQSPPHSAATPPLLQIIPLIITPHPLRKRQLKETSNLFNSRERPFNVIGPQRPRPIYTRPLCDHQSQNVTTM